MPDALKLAEYFESIWAWGADDKMWDTTPELQAVKEIRRQHAEIEQLKAKYESLKTNFY